MILPSPAVFGPSLHQRRVEQLRLGPFSIPVGTSSPVQKRGLCFTHLPRDQKIIVTGLGSNEGARIDPVRDLYGREGIESVLYQAQHYDFFVIDAPENEVKIAVGYIARMLLERREEYRSCPGVSIIEQEGLVKN